MYEKGYRTFSTEALAVLLCKLWELSRHSTDAKVLIATWTDNRGNGAAHNKLTTTRLVASAVLMELSSYMKQMAWKIVVEW